MIPDLFFLAVLLSTVSPTFANLRIYGGHLAKLAEYPMMAQIFSIPGEAHICGGAVITQFSILTAAHCFPCPKAETCIKTRLIMIGDVHLHLNHNIPKSRQIIPIKKLIVHEGYHHDGYDNDIAMLFLKWDIQFSKNVKPCLLSNRRPATQKRCTILGWGRTEEDPDPPDLLATSVSIKDPSVCFKDLKNYKEDTMICAGDRTGHNASCHGDSGGPLLCGGAVVGIAAFGRKDCHGIVAYTDVSMFLNWITHKGNLEGKRDGSSKLWILGKFCFIFGFISDIYIF